ncbi:lactate racemase domain-containing protein [Budvicia diplopodorum]|uniref:lactate racemase domain-containing protein n=1 Tax=Budvicia diplopodorum TaxID=1119056 RepID=UPI00135852FF|nr:lactate racemase domain-containing protein [Budvicia diplopodorum]
MSFIDELLQDVPLPNMIKIRQHFASPDEIADIESVVREQLNKPEIRQTIKPGMTIAVGVGSRGIAQIPRIARAVITELKALGAKPFAVPAMGSHGGATAEGQRHVLENLGMTEETLGCEIRSSMETVKLGELDNGLPILMDKNAMQADGIIAINRIKAHNAFTAPIESGIIKMITIGFGKQDGADSCHTHGFGNMAKNIVDMARIKVKKAPFLFGVGTVENAYDQVVKIEAIAADRLEERETALLAESKTYFPKIMFDNVDIAVIDLMGKIYSGGGMDGHVMGRAPTPFVEPIATIRPDRITVLDLHHQSGGNATGMGWADYCTQRLYDKVDLPETYPNVITSRLARDGFIPVIMSSDKRAIQVAIKTCIILDGRTEARMVRIANTLHVGEIYISENMLEDAKANNNIEILTEPTQFIFDQQDNFTDIGQW